MHAIITILIIIMSMPSELEPLTLFDFSTSSDLSNWRVIDDGVMGGLSEGNFSLNQDGHGHYTGDVSLDNNGGFSSLRLLTNEINVNDFTKICIVLKGDGKDYQVRLKSSRYDRHSYTASISTTGAWQTIEIMMSDMAPTFRGRRLDIPNYPVELLSEFAILIGNKKAERFDLLIDKIFLT